MGSLIGEEVISLRDGCTGQRPVHLFKMTAVTAVALAFAAPTAASASVHAAPATAVQQPVAAGQTVGVGQSVADFYRGRNNYPLWLAPTAGDAAQQLVNLLSSANLDGLDPQKYHVDALRQAIEQARTGKRKRVEDADLQLSNAFFAYVSDLRQAPDIGTTYVDESLRPKAPTALAALLGATIAPSLTEYVHTLGWMNPIYAELRDALASHSYSTDDQRQLIELNMQRARALPAGKQRYVLVNAAQQRLYMYENGKPVDSMVVVVGKPKWATPMLTAYIRYAALNPYWYVPSDLAGEDVGQYVLKYGLKYLDEYGYQIVDDWTANPKIIDPKTIDWKGVVNGKVDVLIRQKPGPKNFMGRMKFMFPNKFGVYLHDNPRRDLFLKSTRYFSGGCVRLEDAARLGRWLFGHDLDWQAAGTEQPVPLATPVPVYITYLTAMPDGASVAYYDDVYNRDTPRLAGAAPAIATVSAAASSGNR